TQSMMLLAIASGSPFSGAMIMTAFTIGTTPLFFALGLATKSLFTNKKLTYFAAMVVGFLAISSLNTGQILRGSNHTLQNYWSAIASSEAKGVRGAEAEINSDGIQEATIDVITGGYRSEINILKVGVPVRLNLVTNNTRGCSRAFIIP